MGLLLTAALGWSGWAACREETFNHQAGQAKLLQLPLLFQVTLELSGSAILFLLGFKKKYGFISQSLFCVHTKMILEMRRTRIIRIYGILYFCWQYLARVKSVLLFPLSLFFHICIQSIKKNLFNFNSFEEPNSANSMLCENHSWNIMQFQKCFNLIKIDCYWIFCSASLSQAEMHYFFSLKPLSFSLLLIRSPSSRKLMFVPLVKEVFSFLDHTDKL